MGSLAGLSSMSLNIRRGSIGEYTVILLMIIGLLMGIRNRDTAGIIATIMALIVYFSSTDPLILTITGFTWSVIAPFMGGLMILIGSLTAFIIGVIHEVRDPQGPIVSETRRLLTLPLLYLPLVFVYPLSLIPMTLLVLATLIMWGRSNELLARVKVRVPQEDIVVQYTEEAEIPVVIDTGGVEVY